MSEDRLHRFRLDLDGHGDLLHAHLEIRRSTDVRIFLEMMDHNMVFALGRKMIARIAYNKGWKIILEEYSFGTYCLIYKSKCDNISSRDELFDNL
ncbi:MAG: hypothetical protein ABJQ14_14765, partial [Hyphomicrobiales bacterium]